MSLAKDTHKPDYHLLLAVAVLVIFGLIMLSSASAAIAFERFHDAYYFVKRQFLIGVVLGGLIGFLLYCLPYQKMKNWSFFIFVVSWVLLLLVFLPGVGESHGTFASRWLKLGPFNFQPSELIKLTFLIYISAWLSTHSRQLNDWRSGFLLFIGLLGGVLAPILLQPDIGTATVIALTAIGVYFLAGAKWKYLALIMAGGVFLLFILVQIRPHAAERLTAFLNPAIDPQGIGYHINQAYLAIGSGGWFGRGFGESRAKFLYLPEVYGDSIFAVVGEELGFVFSLLLVLVFLYICLRGFRISRRAPDDFGKFLAAGIVIWFTGQAFINISAMIGLLPLTGIPLPFVSYGNSSLLTSLMAVGILGNISKMTREI